MRVLGWIVLVLIGVGLTVGAFWSHNHYKGLVAERDQLKTRGPVKMIGN